MRISSNNFDLIRLIAATQVAVHHTYDVLAHGQMGALWIRAIEILPGVPMFFFISGFLISRSYEKSADALSYARNRCLRIFPALHVCVLLNIAIVALTGYFALAGAGVLDVALLYLAKSTILQFYNPQFMRGFGDGVLNGSLWTICVELQFYLLVPVVYRLMHFGRNLRRFDDLLVLACMLVSLVINRALYSYQGEFANSVAWKLLRVSFAPWLYMFLAGMLVQRHFDLVVAAFRTRWMLIAALAYPPLAFLQMYHGARFDNGVGPLVFAPLTLFVLYCAYTRPSASDFLGKNDVSYGVYIYHMVVANLFIHYGLVGSQGWVWLSLAISFALAFASWFLLEKPSIRMKTNAYRPIS